VVLNPASAIINGQVDTFEDGTSDGWQNGAYGDLEVRTGGMSGPNDHYIVIYGSGFTGAGGKIAGFNVAQWTGNYKAANVNAVEMDLKCHIIIGGPKLFIRLGLRSQTGVLVTNGASGYVTSSAFQIADDGLWHHVVFDFSSLVPVNAVPSGIPPPPLSTILSGLVELRIINSASGGVLVGDLGVQAELYIDNIRAVPGLYVTSMTRLGNNTVQLNFKGAPNVTYNVQATADLTQAFSTLGSVTAASDGTFQYTDNNAPSFTQRFYRATFTDPGGRPAVKGVNSDSGTATSRIPRSPSASRR